MNRLRELLSVEGWTLALILLGLAAVEVGFRVAGDRLSGDVAHLDAIDGIVGELDASDALEVLFVGNSLIGEGLDPEGLESGLEDALGRPVEVGLVRPDGSSPLEWYYLLDRYVFEPGRVPDLLVIPFGPRHLFDRDGREATLRLAAHYVATDAVPELFADDLPGFESRAQFVIARTSRAYALRDRVQPRVLDLLIPDYRELAPLILQGGGAAAPAALDAQVAPGDADASDGGAADLATGRSRSLAQLRRLARRAAEAGVPVLYVAMPQAVPWTVLPEVVEVTNAAPPGLLDFRRSLDLEPERFPDGQHMDIEGRERFTERLSAEMLPTVRGLSPGSGG